MSSVAQPTHDGYPESRVKRKPAPAFPYSSKYPHPDPTDPFAPLAVLRERAHSTNTNLVTPPDETYAHNVLVTYDSIDSGKATYFAVPEAPPPEVSYPPKPADSQTSRPWYNLTSGYHSDNLKPSRPPRSKTRPSRESTSYFSDLDVPLDPRQYQQPYRNSRVPEARPRELRVSDQRRDSQYLMRTRSRSVNIPQSAEPAQEVTARPEPRAVSARRQYTYDDRQSHGYMYGEIGELELYELGRSEHQHHTSVESQFACDTSASSCRCAQSSSHSIPSRRPTPPMTPDDTTLSTLSASPMDKSIMARSSSPSPPLCTRDDLSRSKPLPPPTANHVTPLKKQDDPESCTPVSIHSSDFPILQPPSNPPSPIRPPSPLRQPSNVPRPSRFPAESDPEGQDVRRSRAGSFTSLRRGLRKVSLRGVGVRNKKISDPSPVMAARKPSFSSEASTSVAHGDEVRRIPVSRSTASVAQATASTSDHEVGSSKYSKLVVPKAKKSLSHVGLGLKPLPNASLTPSVAPSVTDNVSGESSSLTTRKPVSEESGHRAREHAITRVPPAPAYRSAKPPAPAHRLAPPPAPIPPPVLAPVPAVAPAPPAPPTPPPPPPPPPPALPPSARGSAPVHDDVSVPVAKMYRPEAKRGHSEMVRPTKPPTSTIRSAPVDHHPRQEIADEVIDKAAYAAYTKYAQASAPIQAPPPPVSNGGRKEAYHRRDASPEPRRRPLPHPPPSPLPPPTPPPAPATPAKRSTSPVRFRDPIPASPIPPRSDSPELASISAIPPRRESPGPRPLYPPVRYKNPAPLPLSPPSRAQSPTPPPARSQAPTPTATYSQDHPWSLAQSQTPQRVRSPTPTQTHVHSRARSPTPMQPRAVHENRVPHRDGSRELQEENEAAYFPVAQMRARGQTVSRQTTNQTATSSRPQSPPPELQPQTKLHTQPSNRARSPDPGYVQPHHFQSPSLDSDAQLLYSPPSHGRRQRTAPPTPAPAPVSPAFTSQSHSQLQPHTRIQSARVSKRSKSGRVGLLGAGEFDENALISREQLTNASSLHVVAQNGIRVQFGELFKERKTIVYFIRHFWCAMCQDYMYSVSRNVDAEALKRAGIDLVFVGNGSPGMIKSYRNIFRTPFALYTDPTLRLYTALGMTLRSNDPGPEMDKGAYVRHGLVGGIAMVVKNALRVGMPVWEKGGETMQLGGEFVLGPGMTCSYAHRMKSTRSHAPVLDVLAAAGLQIYVTSSSGMTSDHVSADEDDQWMHERKRGTTRTQAKRNKRRQDSNGAWGCDEKRAPEYESDDDAQSAAGSWASEPAGRPELTYSEEEERARRIQPRSPQPKKKGRSFHVSNPDQNQNYHPRSHGKQDYWRPEGAMGYAMDQDPSYALTRDAVAYSFKKS